MFCILQRQHIRTLLIELQKVCPVLIDKWKMGGDDDLLGSNFSVVCRHRIANKFPGWGMLIDVQILRKLSYKFQRMKLGLIGKADRTLDRKRQGCFPYQFCRDSQAVQSRFFRFQCPAILGIDIVIDR